MLSSIKMHRNTFQGLPFNLEVIGGRKEGTERRESGKKGKKGKQ